MAGAVGAEDGTGDDADEEVVFLDEDEFDADAVWLAEERIHAGRDPEGSLPPRASRSRVLASLVALAVLLGCTGAAFTAAYHRHVTDRQIADTLKLAASSASPTIPGLAALSFLRLWHADVEERIVIPVLNDGPGPVVLLGAALAEPGMTTAAALSPLGSTRLEPGEQGEVGGEITVDCTQDPAAVFPFMDGTGSATVPMPNTAALLVRARTEGGRIGESALDPDADGPDLQVRICQQEGFDITGVPSIEAVGDPRTHSVEVSLSVPSNADIALGYRVTASYSRVGRYSGTSRGVSSAGLSDTSALEPILPTAGSVPSGAMVRTSFTIKVLSCPIQVLPTDEAYIEVAVTAHGNPVDTIEESVHLTAPLTAACGKG